MVRASENVRHIFSELYTVQNHIKSSYIRIKILELLLILSETDFDADKKNVFIFQKNKETVF